MVGKSRMPHLTTHPSGIRSGFFKVVLLQGMRALGLGFSGDEFIRRFLLRKNNIRRRSEQLLAHSVAAAACRFACPVILAIRR
jgi:hypothetical protein